MNVRDSPGKFVKGSSLSTGRLPRKIEDEYIDTISAALTIPSWKKIVKRTIADAQKGDARARELLFKYVLGTQPLVTLNQYNEEPVHLSINWEGAQTILSNLENREKEEAP